MEKGALAGSLYRKYFRAGTSWGFLMLFLFTLIFAQCACNGGDMWVTFW